MASRRELYRRYDALIEKERSYGKPTIMKLDKNGRVSRPSGWSDAEWYTYRNG